MELTFRPVAAADEPFLERLYASTRTAEMAATGWSEAQIEAFLKFQFVAQCRHYATQFPDADHRIILLDGREAGRIYVHRAADAILLVDIALLPEYRNGGHGGLLMQGLLEEGRASGRPVRLHVYRDSPAVRFYERLGFRPIGGTDLHFLMEWRPAEPESKP